MIRSHDTVAESCLILEEDANRLKLIQIIITPETTTTSSSSS